LGKEEPGPGSGCNNTCSFKLRAESSKVLRSMVMANMTEIAGTMDLAMAVSSTITTSHPGVVNSVVIIEGLLRRSMRIGRGRYMGRFRGCDRWFRVLFFDERGRRRCIGS
jgi:hypothetical protein